MEPHIRTLRRTGMVLVAVGALDIAVMLYCIVNGISYSSSLNVFAVLAGVFLMRGSLVAAGLVRWISVFFLAALCTLTIAWPILQPIDLTLTQIRANPMSAALSALLLVTLTGFLFWLQGALGRPSVIVATETAGKKVRSMRRAAVAGVAVVVLVAAVLPVALGGEAGARAIALAQAQIGPGYNYHVSSLSISKTSRGTSVSAQVTAWNDGEVRAIPVQWSE